MSVNDDRALDWGGLVRVGTILLTILGGLVLFVILYLVFGKTKVSEGDKA